MKDRNRDRLGDGDERDVTNISETFKVEKKIRDEEEEMNKYIEKELLRRRGIESAAEKSNTFEVKKLSEILDPKSLYELPEVNYYITNGPLLTAVLRLKFPRNRCKSKFS